MKRVSVSPCKVRDTQKWRVRWHDAGKPKRNFFNSRTAADTFAAEKRGEAVGVKQLLAAIPQADQEKLVMIYNEARRRNVDLLQFLSVETKSNGTGQPIGEVIAEIAKVKRAAGRAESYVSRLEQICGSFCAGRESAPISQFTLDDVQTFMLSRTINYRPTLRSKLSTLFEYALRRGYRKDNPCHGLEAINVPHKTPDVFKVNEVKKCLEYLRRNPTMLAWFALSTFAGLRPEEAQKTSWASVNLKEGLIKVEAQTSKVGQRRVVYPPPAALAWLSLAKKKKSVLPLSPKQRVIGRHALKKVLGWKEWKFDVTRHTAASYWLAESGSADKVATALGHSESMLKKHYMALVTKAEAKKFWAILPPGRKPRPAPSAPPAPADTNPFGKASGSPKISIPAPRSP